MRELCIKPDRAGIGDDGVERMDVDRTRNRNDPLNIVSDADRGDLSVGPEVRDGAIVVTGAVTEATALEVEGDQGHEQDLRADDGATRVRVHGPEGPLIEGIARPPGA